MQTISTISLLGRKW